MFEEKKIKYRKKRKNKELPFHFLKSGLIYPTLGKFNEKKKKVKIKRQNKII